MVWIGFRIDIMMYLFGRSLHCISSTGMLLHGQDCIEGWILHKLHKLMQIYGPELHKRPLHGPDPVGPGHGAANRSILEAEKERERETGSMGVFWGLAGWCLLVAQPPQPSIPSLPLS